jgi:hypothetical protein
MHGLWGMGQMMFTKYIIVVDDDVDASLRICRNPVGVVPVSPRSPKVGAGAPTLCFGPQPCWGWREKAKADKLLGDIADRTSNRK